MKPDARILLFSLGEASFFESIVTIAHLGVSASARRKHRQYVALSQILGHAFGKEDELYHLNVRSSFEPVDWKRWAVLGALVVAFSLEWRTLTGPSLQSWFQVIMHRCGLR